eukprot:gene2285-biopygen11389
MEQATPQSYVRRVSNTCVSFFLRCSCGSATGTVRKKEMHPEECTSEGPADCSWPCLHIL